MVEYSCQLISRQANVTHQLDVRLMLGLRNYRLDFMDSRQLPVFFFVGPERTASSWLHKGAGGPGVPPEGQGDHIFRSTLGERSWSARLQVLIFEELETDPEAFLQAICPEPPRNITGSVGST